MGLSTEKVGIVGGQGRMGSWFAEILKEQGVEALCTGPGTEISPREMARQCRIVVVSVPIAATIEVIRDIGALVPADGLLMDLTSLKKAPVDAMLKYSRAQVVGLHPLFGPAAENQDLSIGVCPGRGREGLEWITDIFRKSGIRPVFFDPEAHDRVMGLIQGVHHFATLALALCIKESGYGREYLVDCATRTFTQNLDRIKTMLEQPSGLFGSLLMDNPFTEETMKIYLESCERLERITKEGDRETFQKLFESLGDFFSKEGEKS